MSHFYRHSVRNMGLQSSKWQDMTHMVQMSDRRVARSTKPTLSPQIGLGSYIGDLRRLNNISVISRL